MKKINYYVIITFLILSPFLIKPLIAAEESGDKKKSETPKTIVTDDDKQEAIKLIDFIYKSSSQYQAAQTVIATLTKNGFKEVSYSEKWKIKKGGKYFIAKNNSTVIAFVVSSESPKKGFNIIAAHTDSPGIHIKPNPEIVKEGYLKLNTETYGGPILSTWFDKPLGLAGKVVLKTDNILKPEIKLINIDEPVAMIPNLAIHLTDDKDKKIKEKKQEVLLPILETVGDKFENKNYLKKYIATKLSVPENNILSFDMMFYPYLKGTVWGINNEFIASARIDDLEAVYAGLNALINTNNSTKINVLACIDSEEVGSLTRQGADSPFFSNILEKIVYSLGGTREDFFTAITNSYMISADVGHAIHPNYVDKNDPTTKPVINKGILVAVSSSTKFMSDAESIGIIKAIAEKVKVPLQMSSVHSDIKGGSTFGPIVSRHLDFRGVDLGLAVLGMHSTNETCGVLDHQYMMKLLKEFYNTK